MAVTSFEPASILNQGFHDNTDSPFNEQSMINVQRWFERVCDAVRIAHMISFVDTDIGPRSPPDFEADDPDFTDNFIAYDIYITESLVIKPPELPRKFDMDTKEEACALWLASQEAILSMTRKSKTVDPHEVHYRLSSLTDSIMRCENIHGPYCIDQEVHYHSTRILLSLLALFAPSFAEACWVALHYGQDQQRDEEPEEETEEGESTPGPVYKYPRELIDPLIREELEKYGYRNFPRRDDHRTLSSIFAQPFPVPQSSKVIRLLRQRSSQFLSHKAELEKRSEEQIARMEEQWNV